MNLRLLWLLLALSVTALASAHPTPYSFIEIARDDNGVHGTLVIQDYDAAHELDLADPGVLLDAATVKARSAELLDILGRRIRIALDGQDAKPLWQAALILAERQSLQFDFSLDARTFAKLQIEAWLFPYDPSHQTFLNIYESGVLRHQAVLDAEHDSLLYYAGTLQGRWLVVRTFVVAGTHHILIGPDHVLFLMGLLLLGGGLWKLAGIVTAFTLGHSLTLSLAALGLLQLSPRLVESTIALSIVVVGVDNLMVRERLDSAARAARDLRPALAGVFGLVHGFGFATVLQDLGLPRDALIWSLGSFNIGVELGQLIIVIVVTSTLMWLRRRHAVLAERCVLFGSIVVIAAGAYWFVQRVWFTPG